MTARGPEVQNLPNAAAKRGRDYEFLRLVKELEWLRTLAHVAPVGIFRADAAGICTYVNDRWSEISGCPPQTACGSSWELAVHPEDVDHLRKEWHRCLAERVPFSVEHRFLHPNRRIVWVLTQVVRDVDGRGRVIGYTGTSTETTEMRAMREAHQRSHLDLEIRMQHRAAELQRMARIVESIDDAVMSADLDGRVTSWNRGAEEIFGYTAAEMIGQPIYILAAPERQEHARALEKRLGAGEEVHRFETVGVTRAGERLQISISGFALREPDGKITGTWAIMRNITERKRAEAALRASEAKYRRLHETMRDAFVKVDMEGRIIEFNRAYQEMLGYDEQELAALTYMDLTPPRWRAEDASIAAEQVIPLGYSEVHEKEYRRKDGTIVPVELRSFLLRDDDGRPAAIWAIVRDVTERTRVQNALRESEERLRMALDNGQHGLWDWDVVTGATHLDDRWFEIHGLKRHETRSPIEDWHQRVHPEDRDRMIEAVELNLSREASAFDVDYRIRRGDGFWIWINSCGRVSQRDAEGKALRMMGTIRDITERKRVEHQLQQLSRRLMQLQDDERRRIARDLHDSTAQTLTALSMNLSALAREESPLPEARRRQLLEDSMVLAERATGELRTTSYLLHPPLLDERGLASALRWFTEGFAQRSKIEVKLVIAPEVERMSPEVETAIFRVVQESLHNAHRHSGSKKVEIRLNVKDGELVLEVRDWGCGMKPSREENPGVGIAGMKERMLQLGGKLVVASNDPGTAVIAHLPLQL